MKTQNLLLSIGVAALAAITFNASAGNTLLSPRDAGNQSGYVSGTANDVNTVAANTATISPRAAGNQITTSAGANNELNPALACAKNMKNSPKAVQACVQHTTMPGCHTVAVAPVK